jgi:hypothetical protein
LYLVSDAGVKTLVGGTGLATDSLWDAAGDLVQGSGANTAAKLSAGTAGKVLTSNGAAAALSWETAPSGAMATDVLWDAAGDLAQGTGANTGAKLSAGSAGMFLKSAGAAAANLWEYPPGYELDYAQVTSGVSVTATTGATATTAITGASVAYDGSTIIQVTFGCTYLYVSAAASAGVTVVLYDGSTELGQLGAFFPSSVAADNYIPGMVMARRLTPSNASHTYSIRAYKAGSGTVTIAAGAGAAGQSMPAFMRITKV